MHTMLIFEFHQWTGKSSSNGSNPSLSKTHQKNLHPKKHSKKGKRKKLQKRNKNQSKNQNQNQHQNQQSLGKKIKLKKLHIFWIFVLDFVEHSGLQQY